MHFIHSSTVLHDFCKEFSKAAPAVVAIDTEFIRQNTYWPKLCLIQLAYNDQCWLIDPLSMDQEALTCLKDILFNKDIVKIFHAGRQDLEIFWQLWKQVPFPIFDTQIAAMFCGYGEGIGYESLVSQTLAYSLDKSSQFTNWAMRPLSEAQLIYAQGDVTHLLKVYTHLKAMLADLGRKDWVMSECHKLTDETLYNPPTTDAWRRIKHKAKQSGRICAHLQDLAQWREECARLWNVNRGSVLSDETLVHLALKRPTCEEELKEMLPSISSENILSLWNVLSKSYKRPSDSWPQLRRPRCIAQNYQTFVDQGKALLAQTALDLNIPVRLIASKEEVEEFMLCQERTSFGNGWKQTYFGKALTELRTKLKEELKAAQDEMILKNETITQEK